MRLEAYPPPFFRHSDANPLGRAMLPDPRVRAFHQPPGRWLNVAAEHEHRLAHPALHIDAMDIADFRQHALRLLEWMPELAKRDEVIG